MSCVQKHDVMHTKNLHIVTRQGTKVRNDNPRISKIKEKMIILTRESKNNYITMHQTYFRNLLDKKQSMTNDKAHLKNYSA